MPGINILVARLGLGYFSWLKDGKRVNIYWMLIPRSQTFYVCVRLQESVYHPKQMYQKSWIETQSLEKKTQIWKVNIYLVAK